MWMAASKAVMTVSGLVARTAVAKAGDWAEQFYYCWVEYSGGV